MSDHLDRVEAFAAIPLGDYDDPTIFGDDTQPPIAYGDLRALCAEVRKLREDKARLDWLEERGNGAPWCARDSATGRGYRLHNTDTRTPSWPTVREALDAGRGTL